MINFMIKLNTTKIIQHKKSGGVNAVLFAVEAPIK